VNTNDRGETRNDAFHITAATNMASIAAEGFRVDGRGVLGTGAYFDLVDESTGWKPARQQYPDQPLVVFRCEVVLGQVLDMDDNQIFDQIRQFQRQLGQRLGRETTLFELTNRTGITYDTIKRTFTTDGQTRIAVRDPQRIRVLSVHNEKGDELPWPPTSN
jgi:hypothetical protein